MSYLLSNSALQASHIFLSSFFTFLTEMWRFVTLRKGLMSDGRVLSVWLWSDRVVWFPTPQTTSHELQISHEQDINLFMGSHKDLMATSFSHLSLMNPEQYRRNMVAICQILGLCPLKINLTNFVAFNYYIISFSFEPLSLKRLQSRAVS